MTLKIGHLSFNHATYDESGDVLYLHIGEPQAAAESEETPDNRPDDHQRTLAARS